MSARPTEKQIQFAKRLAGVDELPPEVTASRDACSKFIEDLKHVSRRPPPDSYVDYVCEIARKMGVNVPESALADAKACHMFVNNLHKLEAEAAAS